MKEQLEKRLAELKAEFESGQKVMAELDTKQANCGIRYYGSVEPFKYSKKK